MLPQFSQFQEQACPSMEKPHVQWNRDDRGGGVRLFNATLFAAVDSTGGTPVLHTCPGLNLFSPLAVSEKGCDTENWNGRDHRVDVHEK